MSFTVVHPDQASYFGKDLADVDQIIWSPLMFGCPPLEPSGDFIQDLDSLLHNRSPLTGEKLRPNDGRMNARQCVLTSIKDISVLELCDVNPDLRQVVKQAACACLELVSMLAAPEDKQPEGTRQCCVAGFADLQRLTASGLPHRHGHLVVLSLCYNLEKERVTYANLNRVKTADRLLQALFLHKLAWGASRLRYGIVPKPGARAFEIEGFQDALGVSLNAGPRGKKGIPKRARLAEQFALLKAEWKSIIGEEGLRRLQNLPRRTPAPPVDFEAEFVASVERQLRQEFHLPAVSLAAGALLDTMGRATADLALIARFVLGKMPAGLEKIQAFSMGKYICLSDQYGLSAERDFYRVLRGQKPAKTGWCRSMDSVGWWAEPLRTNRDRVAILRGRFSDKDVAILDAELSKQDGSTLVIPPWELGQLRAQSSKIRGQLRRGGRVLFVGDAGNSADSVWLDHLPRDTGIKVWQQSKVKAGAVQGAGLGLPFKIHCGSAVDIFANQFAHRPGALFICAKQDMNQVNQSVRKQRKGLSRRADEIVKRAALVVDKETVKKPRDVRPGQWLQVQRGALAGELMPVVAVNQRGITVERTKFGLQEIIRAKDLEQRRLSSFNRVEMEVAVGERIRITRNGQNANVTGMKLGRRYRVRRVERDGTLQLEGGRVMPPDCWHWSYDYCAVAEGPVLAGSTVVTAAATLPTLHAGWMRPGVDVRVCDANQEDVDDRMHKAAVAKVRQINYLPATIDIALSEALEFKRKQAVLRVKPEEVTPAMPPSPQRDNALPGQTGGQNL